MRERGREAETQAEGEAGSLQGAQCGTQSQDPGVTTWAKGRRQTAAPPRDPYERYIERGREIGRGRSRLPTGSPMRDSIPGPQDHALSRRQTLNH